MTSNPRGALQSYAGRTVHSHSQLALNRICRGYSVNSTRRDVDGGGMRPNCSSGWVSRAHGAVYASRS